MESKDPKSTASAETDEGVESKDPKSDATSSETLSDVEETEKVPDTDEGGAEESEGSPVPSPDGAFDEGRGGDGLEDAGPM
ncbi:MAG: hypothetical protein QOH25_859 [Acidobacteriota bacterium]|jgi:hypothetical protein|nr:hypothetical protein [Acidobacteriota bacterium]